jgi:hypothetical protein
VHSAVPCTDQGKPLPNLVTTGLALAGLAWPQGVSSFGKLSSFSQRP